MLHRRVIGRELRRLQFARESEVEELHAKTGEENVRRFQIAMNEAAAVQRVERGQDGQRDANRFRERNGAAPEPFGERLAVEQLHDEKRRSVGVADVEELADVRMRQTGRGARFAHEAFANRRVARFANRLDGDGAVQPLVFGRIHHAHPALPELAHDAIRPDPIEHVCDIVLQELLLHSSPA